jgi:hypothetical protein
MYQALSFSKPGLVMSWLQGEAVAIGVMVPVAMLVGVRVGVLVGLTEGQVLDRKSVV